MIGEHFLKDMEATAANRERLRSNRNLMYWYRELFAEMFRGIGSLEHQEILEIGSGASPLTMFCQGVKTSDVLPMEYLDYVFDAHQIDSFDRIADASVDIVVLVNVLHHLHEPLLFLTNAAIKIKPGGLVIFAEPYLSWLSGWIYRNLHHEALDLSIETPTLEDIKGPLTSSNQALPHLIFFQRPDWMATLDGCYEFSRQDVRFFTSLSYMASGGISRRLPVPHFLYRAGFGLDRALAGKFPKLTASFFIGKLVRR